MLQGGVYATRRLNWGTVHRRFGGDSARFGLCPGTERLRFFWCQCGLAMEETVVARRHALGLHTGAGSGEQAHGRARTRGPVGGNAGYFGISGRTFSEGFHTAGAGQGDLTQIALIGPGSK